MNILDSKNTWIFLASTFVVESSSSSNPTKIHPTPTPRNHPKKKCSPNE